MSVLIDDIGSFPLPEGISKEEFSKVYPLAREQVAKGKDITETPRLFEKFYEVVKGSLEFKIDSGIDVVNYPQHYDMHRQFLEPIEEFQEDPFLIEKGHAVMPELFVIERESRRLFDERGERLDLKVCVTGALELHLKTDFGFYIYEEVLNNLAESVNRFLKNSILDTKYVKTVVVAIDEPSLGFVDLMNIEEEALISALDKSVRDIPAEVQIHLHTLKAVEVPLQVEGIDVIAAEFAATPKNMEILKKRELEDNDKFIRAGVTRTDFDAILAGYLDKGVQPSQDRLIDDVEVIRKRYERAEDIFGERMTFAGPDCGLGSWPTQEVARELLRRT
ncbi:MAG: hypothetical protein ACE5PM_09685, partial [Candidatus Hydrothermarchaeales archaeon]